MTFAVILCLWKKKRDFSGQNEQERQAGPGVWRKQEIPTGPGGQMEQGWLTNPGNQEIIGRAWKTEAENPALFAECGFCVEEDITCVHTEDQIV